MVSETLVVGAHKKQLLHMFNLRGLSCCAKDFYFVLVLLSAIFILVTCKQCTVKEVQNPCESEACRSCRGSFDSLDVIDGHVGPELVSRHPVGQHSLENVCHPPNSFRFPSIFSGYADDITGAKLEALDASEVQFTGFSSGLNRKSNLSQLPHHGNFRFLGGRNISCSLYQEDGFLEFSFNDGGGTTKGLSNDVSSCVSPQHDKMTHSSTSMGNSEPVKFSFVDGLSAPPVEIKPSLLDWGHKNIYHPSLAYLTLKNLDADSVLSVYDSFGSDAQFYPCNFSAMLLAPGEEASICFIFFPTHLGFSSAKLIMQTSFGGFVIQANGFSIESPYLVNPLSDVEVSSSGRWRKNLSLFNPTDDALRVEEVTAWISISSGNTSRSSKSICRARVTDYSHGYTMLNAKDWLAFGRAEVGKPQIALRPQNNLAIGPRKTETILELDISGHFEGKLVGAFCMQLLRYLDNEIDTVMIPLEAELSPKSASDTGLVSLSLTALVPYNNNGSVRVALSVRNDARYPLSVINVTQVGKSEAIFKISSVEGLILFPSTTAAVAFINYSHLEAREVDMNCKIIVLINDTRFPEMEIPCIDVISVCSGHELDSSVGYAQGINVDYINGGDRFFSSRLLPSCDIKAVTTGETDELILRNWKSQATVSSMSVLDKNELLFPMVLVGNYCSQWIAVKNPSPEPVVMQLILNSGEVIDNCRMPEMILQPPSSNTLMGNNSVAPSRYGFSIAKDASTEAFIHPYGSATLGPILFHPSNRCEWRSSAIIRNNLSGVEWLFLQAFGGSLSLVLHEGYNPMQNLEFKLNLPNWLNFSSSDTLRATGGKKTSYCSQPLMKEVYTKNMGDIPLEVIRIKVSGAECGLDGFSIRNCTGFSLQPGESVRLHISYQADFTAATVHRDLELVLAAGILVIPMKASTPICLLNFCKRSLFWMRVKKAMVLLLFAASLMYFIVSLLFPHGTLAFALQDFVSGKNSFSSVIHALDSSHMRFNRQNSGYVFPETNEVVKSIAREEALLLECQGTVNPSEVPSSPSSVLNVDMQDPLDSRDLRVRVGKEKGRRRRKKKSSGVGVLLFEASSSQSGNSTPSSPLSPGQCTTAKRPCQVSPATEARNPFSRAPVEQSDKSKCSKNLSKVNNHLHNEVPSKCDNNRLGSSVEDKPCLARKVGSRSVCLPSVAFPSAGGSLPSWTYRSSLLSSTSTIAPHARAPGPKLESGRSGGVEERMGVEQKYTYDIWGDHLFGLPLAYQSKKVSSKPSYSVENDSGSFFVGGPQTLVKDCMLPSVISNLEVNK